MPHPQSCHLEEGGENGEAEEEEVEVPYDSAGKESTCNVEDLGSVPG